MIKFYRYKNLKKIKLISGKKDGYFCGKTRKFNHPPYVLQKIPDKNILKKIYIYLGQKGWLFSGENVKI
jgi:hypothetical protein